MVLAVQVPGLHLGPAGRFANDSQLFFPVAALLESTVPEQSKGALQVDFVRRNAHSIISRR